jgi:hypothetical protein
MQLLHYNTVFTILDQLSLVTWYIRGHSPQAFRHPLRHFSFTDKCIRPGGEGSLVAGIQMADQDDHDRIWAGQA